MPVDRLQGALHAVIECHSTLGSSSLTNPALALGHDRHRPAGASEPTGRRQELKSLISTCSGDRAGAALARVGQAGSPPWLSFSGRWPWVSAPRQSTAVRNGSTPGPLGP